LLILERVELTFGSVVETLRLFNGILFPMPITLDVSDIEVLRYNIGPGARLTLRDFRDESPVAILTGITVLLSDLSDGLLIASRGCLETRQGQRRFESFWHA